MPKILVIRFSSIGDIVLTTPVVRCLKKQLKNIEIHYAVKSKFTCLLNNNPYIDKIYSFKNHINEVIGVLKNENFDYIIDLHNNIRSNLLKFKLRKKSFTVSKLNIQKWLLVNFKINLLPEVHIVDRYIKTVEPLGVKYDGEGLDFFFSENVELPKTVSDFIFFHTAYYVFSIGGTYFTKKCPTQKVIEICKSLSAPVILIGGEQDILEGEIIKAGVGANCINTCEQMSIEQSALVMRDAEYVISNDTGMMHIATALKKHVVSLWGNTIPEFGMAPYLPSGFNPTPAIIEIKGLKCRPCTKLGFEKCPKNHFKCMNDISADEIYRVVSNHPYTVKGHKLSRICGINL